MTTVQMRQQISDVYNSPTWRRKVACMSEGQVITIFYRFLYANKFETNKPKPVIQIKEPEIQMHQVTLFECGLAGGNDVRIRR